MREKKRVEPATLPTLDGSPKQIAWVRDRIRADQVDAFNAVDLPEYLKTRIGGATDDEEEARRLALVRAEIEKRGEAAVLAELEEAAQEIAAKMFEETSCRVWIDGRFGPGVLHRSTTEAFRRVATTGSAKPPKPAFDLPPLDLPELVLTRLEGTPRQQSWAEDLRRRAVRDLTEERANETARDALRRYRDKESAFAEEFRSDLEAAIKAVGGDEAAELILGREIFLDARGYVESFDRARDWINLHVADKKTLLEAAEFHVAGNPQNVAAILRRYAADAKAQAPQSDATRPVVEERREPLFKGDAATEKIVPFEPKFSARETIIFKEMERNRQEASEILKQEGREILPLGKRAQHFIIEARNLGLNLKTLPNGANISGPCTVDRYRDGKWQQRRWYDANGDAEQDYDAAHDGKDVKNSHIFPHLHIWTKNKAGIRCKRSGACATHTRIKKNDRLDD